MGQQVPRSSIHQEERNQSEQGDECAQGRDHRPDPARLTIRQPRGEERSARDHNGPDDQQRIGEIGRKEESGDDAGDIDPDRRVEHRLIALSLAHLLSMTKG